VNRQLKAVVPVMFESGDYYFGYGSSLIVKLGLDAFWVTARHVIEKQYQDIYSLRIFTDSSKWSLSFDSLLDIEADECDPDFSDLFISKVETNSYFKAGGSDFLAHELEPGSLNPNEFSCGSSLIVVGYPESGRSYDYETLRMKKTLTDYAVIYNGHSEGMEHCHSVLFDSFYSAEEYNGLSGAPVYSNNNGALYLVGIMIRASADRGHFIDIGVLKHALDKFTKLVT